MFLPMFFYICVASCTFIGYRQEPEFIDSMIKCNEYCYLSILFKVPTIGMSQYLRNITIPISIEVNGHQKEFESFTIFQRYATGLNEYTLFIVRFRLILFGSIVFLCNVTLFYTESEVLKFGNRITPMNLKFESDLSTFNIGIVEYGKLTIKLDKKYAGYLIAYYDTIGFSFESERDVKFDGTNLIYTYFEFEGRNQIVFILYDECLNFYDIKFKGATVC